MEYEIEKLRRHPRRKTALSGEPIRLFHSSHMVEGPPSPPDAKTNTQTIFLSLLEEVIDANGDLDTALSVLITRARIRLLARTLEWWDCILCSIAGALDGIDASMPKDFLVSSKLFEWRRLWSNWRGLLKKLETTLRQTTPWIKKLKSKREFRNDGLPRLHSRLLTLESDRKRLERRIEASFQALMSTMSIIESRNAVSQGESIGKITELAFFFVPLSFATSFFGMEIKVSHRKGRYTSIL